MNGGCARYLCRGQNNKDKRALLQTVAIFSTAEVRADHTKNKPCTIVLCLLSICFAFSLSLLDLPRPHQISAPIVYAPGSVRGSSGSGVLQSACGATANGVGQRNIVDLYVPCRRRPLWQDNMLFGLTQRQTLSLSEKILR